MSGCAGSGAIIKIMETVMRSFFALTAVGVVAVAALLQADELPSDKNAEPALEAWVGREGSRVRFLTEGDAAIIDIASEFGIDRAAIKRKSDQWPKSIVVRLHLGGLESFKAVSGEVTVEWSISSSGDNPRVLVPHKISYSPSGKEETPLDKMDAYFTQVRIVADKKQIPLEAGYFEVPLPGKLLEKNPQEITLKWIDFYRN